MLVIFRDQCTLAEAGFRSQAIYARLPPLDGRLGWRKKSTKSHSCHLNVSSVHSPSQGVNRMAFVKSCSNILSYVLKRGKVKRREGRSRSSSGCHKRIKEGDGVEISWVQVNLDC